MKLHRHSDELWLPRHRRRHVNKALPKLLARDACSLCGRPLQSGCIAGGFDAKGNLALTGACCTNQLVEIFMLGYDFLLPASVEPTAGQLADFKRRSGLDDKLQLNPSDGPWKDADRIWFEQNPTRSHRLRLPFSGEFDAQAAEAPADHALLVSSLVVGPERGFITALSCRLLTRRGGHCPRLLRSGCRKRADTARQCGVLRVDREVHATQGGRSMMEQATNRKPHADPPTFEPEWEPDPDDMRDREIALKIDLELEHRESSQAKDPPPAGKPQEDEVSIEKPDGFNLDRFRAKRTAAAANVETMLSPLPVHNMSAAKDFVRLHKDEENYWTPELCFVDVPVKGQKHNTLHLIDEDLALRFLEAGEIKRCRLALASKPHDVFFLCTVPTQNLDNAWNDTNLEACEKSKELWTKVVSRKDEGVESYKVTFARDRDSFSDPKWPTQSLGELIQRSFAGRIIDKEDHPALLRKIGAKQSLS
jgi:hypothetical protein